MRRLARTEQLPAELLAVMDGPLADAVAVAADYAGDAITAATRAAYRGDWAEFAAWCRAQHADPTVLPIHPVLVAAYLAGLAGKVGRSALRRRVAAIVYHHRRRGLVWSSQHVAIRETLIGIARRHGKPVRPAAALTSVEVKRLIASCADPARPRRPPQPRRPRGLRDRALFLVGFAGALRRSELVAIDHAHLRFEADCVVIHIPRSKGDQEGKGADVTLPRMRATLTPARWAAPARSATPARCAPSSAGCSAPRSAAARCSAASPRTARSKAGSAPMACARSCCAAPRWPS